MRLVYADNFRGFSSAHVPLTDVNFFVGDNSTGKTSIMNLIRLLSRPEFLFSQSFSSVEAGFTHFDDIVSVTAKDQSQFKVGFVDVAQGPRVESAGRRKESLWATLFTFRESRGLPELAEYAAASEDRRLHVRFDGDKISFLVIRDTPQNLAEIGRSLTFDAWESEVALRSEEFRRLSGKLPRLAEGQRLFLALHLINELQQKDKEQAQRTANWGPYFVERQVVSLAPIRAKPRRTYDEYTKEYSEEGEHTPYLIRKILGTRKEAERFQSFMRRFGQSSGLFEDMKIKRHGRGPTAPFELDIMLSGKALGLNNVGYGVAQALPIVVELFSRPRTTAFSVQQPEVHLHPRGQAALGDVIFGLAVSESKRFYVETHSDYLMDRFRMNYGRSRPVGSPRAQILFFERDEKGNRVVPMAIDEGGQLPAEQPEAYREFFLNEAMRLLKLE
jgi:hypothetical protein